MCYVLQYYATVDDGSVNSADVRWLTAEHVEDRSTSSSGTEMEDQIAAMLGGGQSVGGVVSDPTGTTQQVIF